MHRNLIYTVFLVSAAFCLGSFSCALSPYKSSLIVRGGGFFPLETCARYREEFWLLGGIEKVIKSWSNFYEEHPSGEVGISLDLYSKARHDLYNLPLLVNYRRFWKSIYYSAGLGVGMGRTVAEKACVNGVRVCEDYSKKDVVNFAYQASLGFKPPESNVMLEVRFLGSSRADLTGFASLIGTRF